MDVSLSCFQPRSPHSWLNFSREIRGLPALRHTFLTDAGEYADPFALQYAARHDNIMTTMRFVRRARTRS
jgi:hypothetical protein